MESKNEMPVKLLCMACLCLGRNLRELKDEKLKKYYLDALREVPLYSTLPVSPVVCWECEALLKKALSFKELCKDSYRILQTYTNENLNERLFTEVMCPPVLKIDKRESISIEPNNQDTNIEGMFVYAGVKTEDGNNFYSCNGWKRNKNQIVDCDKHFKDKQNDVFKEEMHDVNLNDNDNEEADVLDITGEEQFSEKKVKSSKHKCVYVKEEFREFDEGENYLDDPYASDNVQNAGTSSFVNVKVPLKSSRGEKEDSRRKKKLNRVKGKKRVKSNKENVNQRPLVGDKCTSFKIDKHESITIDANDQEANVEGVFVYSGLKSEDGVNLDINTSNKKLHYSEISNNFIDNIESKQDDDFKQEIQDLDLDKFENDLDESDALDDIQNEDTSRLMEIDVTLKSSIGEKEDRRRKKKLNRVKGKKRVRINKELKQKSTKILTIDMTYEEMLRDREKEETKERYLKSEYKCESCLLGFSHEGAYTEHNRRRHDKTLGDYSCPICRTVMPSVDSFTAHYKRHTRRYECAICRKRTLDLKVMQQHYYSTHAIALKEYKCNVCGKLSKSIEAHRYHRDSHKARIQCPECEKTYRHRAGLMNHRVAVHEFRNAFPCNKCDKVFRWKTSLKRHLEKHDSKSALNPAPAFCSLCNVSFASISSYQRHLKNSLKHVTQDQLKYICDHCNRRFADKTKLRDHIEEKHLYKTFQCHICLKPSKNRVGLDQHIRNVHKGRPYNAICHYCGKRFPTRVQLESHVRTHTGERPFICEFCPTTFSQQSNLYKHNRQVHLNIKSKRFPICRKRRDDRQQNAVVDNPTAGETYATPTAVWRYSPQRGIIM